MKPWSKANGLVTAVGHQSDHHGNGESPLSRPRSGRARPSQGNGDTWIDKGNGLHTFFEMDDGSYLAFFEVPGRPFDFKRQNDLDLHIALGVENEGFDSMLQKAQAEGKEVRGPVDHGFVRSIYFRDPNGYVVELTASTGVHGEIMDPVLSKPHDALARWQTAKSA